MKPIDGATLKTAAAETGGNLIVVEDHWAQGGLGDAVLEVFGGPGANHPNVTRLAVQDMPGSGTPAELIEAAGIGAAGIIAAVKSSLK